MILVGALALVISMGALLVTFLPFSPMTIDWVKLERGTQIRIHRQRYTYWTVAACAFVVALICGLGPALAGMPGLWIASAISATVMGLLFWLAYVPIVMTPPGGGEHFPAAMASNIIDDDEIILGVSIGNGACAYRRDQIARPHYFYDRVGGHDLMISYCILCNSATAFQPVLNGEHFALECVTAFNNNIIYYDAVSENYIQQLTGEVIEGPAVGQKLPMFPVVIARWRDWRTLYPRTTLYDSPPESIRDRLVALMLQLMIPVSRLARRTRPWHRVRGAVDQRMRAMAFVIGVDIDGDAVGYPLEGNTGTTVINDAVGDTPIFVLHDPKRDIARVFRRELDGRVLDFRAADEAGIAIDQETNSRWDTTGRAIAGELTGQQLTEVAHFNKLFWFSWALFKPETRLYQA